MYSSIRGYWALWVFWSTVAVLEITWAPPGNYGSGFGVWAWYFPFCVFRIGGECNSKSSKTEHLMPNLSRAFSFGNSWNTLPAQPHKSAKHGKMRQVLSNPADDKYRRTVHSVVESLRVSLGTLLSVLILRMPLFRVL